MGYIYIYKLGKGRRPNDFSLSLKPRARTHPPPTTHTHTIASRAELVRRVVDEELQAIRAELGGGSERFAAGEYLDAAFLTKLMCLGRELHDFLTLPAQDIIIAMGK